MSSPGRICPPGRPDHASNCAGSQVAGVMSAHIGCLPAIDILRMCANVIDEKRKRGLN